MQLDRDYKAYLGLSYISRGVESHGSIRNSFQNIVKDKEPEFHCDHIGTMQPN